MRFPYASASNLAHRAQAFKRLLTQKADVTVVSDDDRFVHSG